MEFKLIPPKNYEYCERTADSILNSISTKSHISLSDIRYYDAINYLITNAGPTKLCLFVEEERCTFSANSKELNAEQLKLDYNRKFAYEGIKLGADAINVVSSAFSKNVSGFTYFSSVGPIMFLNAGIRTWERTIFTIMHELVHSFLAMSTPNYTKQVALLNSEYDENPYPEDLQLIESETNVIASLLYAPSCSLNRTIINSNFEDLCSTYSMSNSAMHNRLHNFFYYEKGFLEFEAKDALFAFRNDDKYKRRKYQKTLGQSQSKKLDLLS